MASVPSAGTPSPEFRTAACAGSISADIRQNGGAGQCAGGKDGAGRRCLVFYAYFCPPSLTDSANLAGRRNSSDNPPLPYTTLFRSTRTRPQKAIRRVGSRPVELCRNWQTERSGGNPPHLDSLPDPDLLRHVDDNGIGSVRRDPVPRVQDCRLCRINFGRHPAERRCRTMCRRQGWGGPALPRLLCLLLPAVTY